MRELDFIEWIRSRSDFDSAGVLVGPGDDMAVLRVGGGRLLVATDQVLDGVHFRLTRDGPTAAGRKALARNLSDVAAMAALPVSAVASVALPKGTKRDTAEGIYRGLRDIGDAFDCPVVGGDVSAWDGPLAISVAILARPAGIEPILRSGARPGDAICVTGRLGGAWTSDRHLTFMPRVAEARALAESFSLHALIDISDGLAADLWHICRASGVGAEILADSVPIQPDVPETEPGEALTAALGDGEDHELLFTLPASKADRLVADQPLAAGVSRIGTITAGESMVLIFPDGRREALQRRGWEHRT